MDLVLSVLRKRTVIYLTQRFLLGGIYVMSLVEVSKTNQKKVKRIKMNEESVSMFNIKMTLSCDCWKRPKSAKGLAASCGQTRTLPFASPETHMHSVTTFLSL